MLTDSQMNNLCVHYKDTFDIHRESIKRRDMLFYALLTIIAFFLISIDSFDIIDGTVGKIVKKQYEIDLNRYINKINALAWFAMFWISLSYFQILIQIERQYEYLSKLEKTLNDQYTDMTVFTREGISYEKDYPGTLKWIYILYVRLFPIILICCIAMKIASEWKRINELEYIFVLDFVFFGATFLSTSIYMFDRSTALSYLKSKFYEIIHQCRH